MRASTSVCWASTSRSTAASVPRPTPGACTSPTWTRSSTLGRRGSRWPRARAARFAPTATTRFSSATCSTSSSAGSRRASSGRVPRSRVRTTSSTATPRSRRRPRATSCGSGTSRCSGKLRKKASCCRWVTCTTSFTSGTRTTTSRPPPSCRTLTAITSPASPRIGSRGSKRNRRRTRRRTRVRNRHRRARHAGRSCPTRRLAMTSTRSSPRNWASRFRTCDTISSWRTSRISARSAASASPTITAGTTRRRPIRAPCLSSVRSATTWSRRCRRTTRF